MDVGFFSQISDALTGAAAGAGGGGGAEMGQLLATMGNLMGAVTGSKDGKSGQGNAGMALPVLGSLLEMATMAKGASAKERTKRGADEADYSNSGGAGFDFENLMSVASVLMGQGGTSQGLMGLLPMFLETMSGGETNEIGTEKKHDHSSHSWFMPPILENIHVMWDHFR